MEPRNIDRILAELQARYSLTPKFLSALRPAVQSILADDFPADRRVEMLEMVAETCQRDESMRKDFAVIQGALQGLVRDLDTLGGILRDQKRPDSER